MNEHVDPFAVDQRATDLEAKRALFLEANALLDEKGVFLLAMRSLRRQWFNQLMAARDWETKDDLTRKLQVLEAIPGEINRFVNDYKMATNKRGR